MNNCEFIKEFEKNIFNINENEKIETISSGNINLDNALECGGIPKGRIIEIYGNESSGKTTLALEIAKSCQLNDGNVLLIDVEGSVDVRYLRNIGINMDKFVVAQPTSGELVFKMIENSLQENYFDLIIIDSVAAMISFAEQEMKPEDNNLIGAHARMMSKGLRRIQNLMYKSKTIIIFINQIREKIGVFFGNPETTTGGRALRFFSTIRLEVKKSDLIKNSNEKIGIKSKVVVTKNKLGKPFNSAFINIYFNEGFNYDKDLIDYALNNEIISKKGSWFYFNDKKICQGYQNIEKFFSENIEEKIVFESKIENLLKINNNK